MLTYNLSFSSERSSALPQRDALQEGRGPTVPLLSRPQAAGGRPPGQLLPRGQAGHRDEEEGRATSGTAGTYQGEQAWASQKSHHLQVTFLGYILR